MSLKALPGSVEHPGAFGGAVTALERHQQECESVPVRLLTPVEKQ